jgi:CheY-like chemotaxis protein
LGGALGQRWRLLQIRSFARRRTWSREVRREVSGQQNAICIAMSNSCATTLVVEDDPANRAALVRLLQYSGVLVDWADGVAMAIEKLKNGPKVVLLDVHLSDGLGTEVLEYIRAHGLALKVCVMTESANGQTIEQVKAMRPDEVIVKPCHAKRLVEWVHAAHKSA